MVYFEDDVVKHIFLKLTFMIIYRNTPSGQKDKSNPEGRVTRDEKLEQYGLGLRTQMEGGSAIDGSSSPAYRNRFQKGSAYPILTGESGLQSEH